MPIPYSDRILYSDNHVIAVPGLGPQVFPYIIVVTRRHVTSFAAANCQERNSVLDCLEFINNSGIYGNDSLTVFEHGGAVSDGCSCIEHCHLHVVKASLKIKQHLGWFDGAEQVLISPNSSFEQNRGYLLIADYRNGELKGRVYSTEFIERQYFRKVLSVMIKDADWDWKGMKNNDMIIRTIEYFKRH